MCSVQVAPVLCATGKTHASPLSVSSAERGCVTVFRGTLSRINMLYNILIIIDDIILLCCTDYKTLYVIHRVLR